MICTDDLQRKNKRLSKEVQSSGIRGSGVRNRKRQVILKGMEEKGDPLEFQELKRKLTLIRKIEQKNTKQMKNKCISDRKESRIDEKGQMSVVIR